MYILKALMKSGVTIVIAECERAEYVKVMLDELKMKMTDPTVAKTVFEDGDRLVAAKDISAVWCEVSR